MAYHWTRANDLEALPDSLSVAKVKKHLRVLHDLEDDQITLYTRAAAYLAMDYANRALLPVKYTMRTANTPSYVELPIGTYGITMAVYMDVNSQMQQYDSSHYYAVQGNPSWLTFNPTAPKTRGNFDDVRIDVVAGYERVPENVIAAILLITGTLYENRESDSPIEMKQIPTAQLLLDVVRILGVS